MLAITGLAISSRMSAFPESGRSEARKRADSKVRFRPKADLAHHKSHRLDESAPGSRNRSRRCRGHCTILRWPGFPCKISDGRSGDSGDDCAAHHSLITRLLISLKRFSQIHQRLNEIQRQWEDDRICLVASHFLQCLQIAELQCLLLRR